MVEEVEECVIKKSEAVTENGGSVTVWKRRNVTERGVGGDCAKKNGDIYADNREKLTEN